MTLTGIPILILAQSDDMQKRRANYLLNCGGCHGLEGVSNREFFPKSLS
jgi:cytochrome c553